jgi:hypothetical protein
MWCLRQVFEILLRTFKVLLEEGINVSMMSQGASKVCYFCVLHVLLLCSFLCCVVCGSADPAARLQGAAGGGHQRVHDEPGSIQGVVLSVLRVLLFSFEYYLSVVFVPSDGDPAAHP